jgi:hypothetical protein
MQSTQGESTMRNIKNFLPLLILLSAWCGLALTGCEDEELRKEALDIMEEAGVVDHIERAEMEYRLESVDVLAEDLIALAQDRAEAILREAQEAGVDALEEPLQNVRAYQGDGVWHNVQEAYLVGFQVEGRTLYYQVKNETEYGIVKPRFDVILLDENDGVTGIASIFWITEVVNPGEVKEEDTRISIRLSDSPTKYYGVVFGTAGG